MNLLAVSLSASISSNEAPRAHPASLGSRGLTADSSLTAVESPGDQWLQLNCRTFSTETPSGFGVVVVGGQGRDDDRNKLAHPPARQLSSSGAIPTLPHLWSPFLFTYQRGTAAERSLLFLFSTPKCGLCPLPL